MCSACCADDAPALVLPPLEYPSILAPYAAEININDEIMDLYVKAILPGACE